MATPLPDARPPGGSYCQLSCRMPGAIHTVRQLTNRPAPQQLGQIDAGDGWNLNTKVAIGWGRAWELREALFHEIVSAGRAGVVAADLADYFAGRPQRLAAWIGDFSWRELDAASAAEPSRGAFLSDDPLAAPQVINEMPDHLVVVDGDMASKVEVRVANGITCVTRRDKLDHIGRLLDAVDSSPYADFVRDADPGHP